MSNHPRLEIIGPAHVAIAKDNAVSAHLSVHPNCLHIWRPHGVEIPQPPAYFV